MIEGNGTTSTAPENSRKRSYDRTWTDDSEYETTAEELSAMSPDHSTTFQDSESINYSSAVTTDVDTIEDVGTEEPSTSCQTPLQPGIMLQVQRQIVKLKKDGEIPSETVGKNRSNPMVTTPRYSTPLPNTHSQDKKVEFAIARQAERRIEIAKWWQSAARMKGIDNLAFFKSAKEELRCHCGETRRRLDGMHNHFSEAHPKRLIHAEQIIAWYCSAFGIAKIGNLDIPTLIKRVEKYEKGL